MLADAGGISLAFQMHLALIWAWNASRERLGYGGFHLLPLPDMREMLQVEESRIDWIIGGE